MKTESQEQLLERYREGTLSDGDLAELNRLSHRDEVMAAAGQRAASIVRRRTQLGVRDGDNGEWRERVDDHIVDIEVVGAPETYGKETTVAVEEAVLPEPPAPITHVATVRPHKARKQVDEEPVVMCNNQCEADSVISDIWKFLTV